MKELHQTRFPGESKAYRAKRFELLAAEMELRERVEQVAALRRKLPLGGELKEDYVFEEGARRLSDTATVKKVRFSKLFAPGKDTLLIYSFMYGPKAKAPCPLCTSLLDSLNGAAPHVGERINFAVVAKGPLKRTRKFAASRNWNNLRLLSSAGNTYNQDYFGQGPDGSQFPQINVFRRTKEGIFHYYSSELFFTDWPKGMDARHVDSVWPLWNLFDLTPEGRGGNWYPQVKYA